MAQEPSSKDLLEAVKQQESGGRRYDRSGKLLEGPMTKYGTAKGEMQVLDLTTKDPGYGVKPARDDSPDERARVGRDYLAAMVKKYGDEKTALVAYNWGPGNTDRWLKKGGDFSRLPKETQNYVAKVTGSLGSTKLAQAPATTKVKKAGVQQAVYKAAPLSHPMLSQLGPNFQAAMAVSMLADEAEKEGKSEDEPSEAEKMLTQATVQPVALASVDLGYQSPFPEVAPKSNAPAKQQLQAFKHGGAVRMANGGRVSAPSGGDTEYFQDPMGAPSAPVTADTLAKGKEFRAADALRMAKEFGTALGSNTESLVRGAVAQVPGAVGDLESLSRKGINFLYGPGGVNVSEKTVAPTSEEIRARVPRITATRPESSGMESMGELMAPGLAKAAAPVAKAAAKGTAKEMLRGMEGQGVLAPISPQESIMYAVRNKTTPFVMTRRPDTSVDAFIDEMSSAEKAAFREKYPDVNFFDDKGMQGTQEYKNFIKAIDEPEHLVRYELRPVPGTIAMENLRKDPIVGEWFNRTVPKYLRKDFATEEDQLVKAADQGKLLHFAPKKGELKEGAKEYVEAVRRAEGFSSQGEAKEPYGKYVEALVDQSVYPSQLQDIGLEYQIPPSLVKFLETNPEKRVSELAPAADKLLKLFELRKDMLRIRQIGPEYSAYGQPAETIPTNFTLPDNLLPRFNLAEVSNRVARFTRWEDETRSRMATSALREDPQLTRNYLQDGKYISVALPDPVKKPAYKSLITDVGCDGGWCTAQEQNALSYGSGKSQLHVLVTGTEKNARPVAQVSVEEIGRDLDGRPKYSITDIKEKGNTENFKTNPALPAIQEQVKLLDNQYGGFKGVHALEKLGMAEIPKSTPKWLADSVPLTQPFGFFKGVREEAIRLNGGSQYVIGEKEDATSLVQQAYKNLFGPIEGFAKGGMVERQASTARYI